MVKIVLNKVTYILFSLLFLFNCVDVRAQEYKMALDKFVQAFQIIYTQYTDTVDASKMTEDAIEAMLKELDPHSVYLTKKESGDSQTQLKGNFSGIGIQFQIINDTITVISAISGGPSEKMGIMSGDKIVKVDSLNAIKKSNTWVTDHVRGKKGSTVKLKIFRPMLNDSLDFAIVRDDIPIYSVDAHYMINDDLGYIKLNRFSRTSYDEVHTALLDLKSKGMKDLILDLRDNPGGYLDIAVKIADEFLDDKQLIVYTEGRVEKRRNYFSTEAGDFQTGKIAVLVNEGSASASEIVSGALQDHDRGLVIGRRTFGKGLVQRPYYLRDKSELRLTIARYYTPSGRSIQKPYTKGREAYNKEVAQRFERGELTEKDSIHFADSLKFKTDAGRTVYGGGGIMPDKFVPYDTANYSPYFKQLLKKGIPFYFANQYALDNKDNLKKKYPDGESFIKKFHVDDDLRTKYITFAEGKGVKEDKEGYKTSEEMIETQLKALIGRVVYDQGVYFRIINTLSDEYNTAIKMLK